MSSKFMASISDVVRSEIERELVEIEQEFAVTILFAIESGSRAWGFPSPDSDYDVRFVYAHEADWYLSVFPGRDVIERPISDELDIGGWDIKKALALTLKSNAVVFEWLASPIRYRWNEEATAAISAFASKAAQPSKCLYHYLHLGESNFRRNIEGRERFKLKKYFCCLRPALALRWLRDNPDTIPPMNLQVLLTGLKLDDGLVRLIDELVEKKSGLGEAELTDQIPEIDAFCEGEFAWAKENPTKSENRKLEGEADALLRQIVHGHAGG